MTTTPLHRRTLPSAATPRRRAAPRLRPDLGGAVAGLWHRETPILRSTEPAALEGARASAMFPLLPYSNRLGYRRFRWKGRDYTTRANVDDSPHSLHGIGWQRPWRIVSSSAIELVLGLEHAGDADWPFAFEARQYFTLAPESFSARLQFTNTGESRAAGRAWAFIPTSSSGRAAGCTSRLAARWEADATKLPTRKVAQPGIDADLSHLDYDHCFEGWRGRARIRDERFSLQLVSELPYLVVYTPPERDYFCVEPVSHSATRSTWPSRRRTAWWRSRRARRSRPRCGSTSPSSSAPQGAAPRKAAGLADRHHRERVVGEPALASCDREGARRLVERFVGEREGAPVDADRASGGEVEMDLHRLGRVDVLLLHEPARLVGADRQQRQVEAAVRRSLAAGEARADIGEVLRVAGVAGEEGLEVGREHGVAAPERLHPVGERASGPMLRRHEHDLDAARP